MTASSAGILTYRVAEHGTRVRLVHPGGPFRRHIDLGARSIPKGEPFPQEAAEKIAARREFAEELGAVLERALTQGKPDRFANRARMSAGHFERYHARNDGRAGCSGHAVLSEPAPIPGEREAP